MSKNDMSLSWKTNPVKHVFWTFVLWMLIPPIGIYGSIKHLWETRRSKEKNV